MYPGTVIFQILAFLSVAVTAVIAGLLIKILLKASRK